MAERFRKKPVVIEAVQFNGSNHDEVTAFIGCDGHFKDVAGMAACPYNHRRSGPRAVFIDTLEGTHRADPGDWIIRGVQGEFYPCKPDIFAQTYEAVEA